MKPNIEELRTKFPRPPLCGLFSFRNSTKVELSYKAKKVPLNEALFYIFYFYLILFIIRFAQS